MSKKRITLCLLVLFSFVLAMGVPADAASPKKKVIIDTDMGWDDTLSILYLMKHSDIEIIGVTVTGCGETFLSNGVHNALALMEMGNIDAPVCVGADKPLKFDHRFPESFKADMSRLMGLAKTYPEVTRKPSEKKAWDFIADTLNSTEEKVTILSLGGFSNVALMMQKRPNADLSNIEQIVAMGGAVYVDGNISLLNNAKKEWDQGPIYSTNYRAEFNIFVDPLAARMVFHSPIPIMLVPLDACDYVILQRSFMDRITADDPIAKLVKAIFDKKTGSSSEGIPVPIFDPLATLLMAGPMQPNQINTLNLDVCLEEDPKDNRCGQTYISNFSTDKLIDVAQGVSERAFKKEYARVINRDIK